MLKADESGVMHVPLIVHLDMEAIIRTALHWSWWAAWNTENVWKGNSLVGTNYILFESHEDGSETRHVLDLEKGLAHFVGPCKDYGLLRGLSVDLNDTDCDRFLQGMAFGEQRYG